MPSLASGARTRAQLRSSGSSQHISLLWRVTMLALVVAGSSASGSPLPGAPTWGATSSEPSWQVEPVCRAATPFLDPRRPRDPYFRDPYFWSSTLGAYSPYGGYGFCSSPAAPWGPYSYYSTPLLYADAWRGSLYPPTLASRWDWRRRTAWMPWYSPYVTPFPLYCPPHARPRGAAAQASAVLDRPRFEGAADWVPGPEAEPWNAVFAERRHSQGDGGLIVPIPLPRTDPGGTARLTDRPVVRVPTPPTPGVRRQPMPPTGWRSRPGPSPSAFSSSPRTTGGSPSVSRAPVQRPPSRPSSANLDRPRPKRE